MECWSDARRARISGAQDREGDEANGDVTGYLNVEFRIQNADCKTLKNEDAKKNTELRFSLPKRASNLMPQVLAVRWREPWSSDGFGWPWLVSERFGSG
jgi:hypothetical protein